MMQITDKVSWGWLQENNLTKGEQIGIPRFPLSLGVTWKNMWELDELDFNALDDYYDSKKEVVIEDGKFRKMETKVTTIWDGADEYYYVIKSDDKYMVVDAGPHLTGEVEFLDQQAIESRFEIKL